MKARAFFETIEEIFLQSLKDELDLTPKPGCVDGQNSGPHIDMDYDVFLSSISSLKGYFFEIMMLSNTAKSFVDTFDAIRPIGMRYEKKMYEVASGINTHKGAIFTLGVIACAIGKIYYDNKYLSIDLISEYVKKLCANIFDDFNKEEMQTTNGMRIYQKNAKHSGIRYEAKNGFKTALDAYDFYKEVKDFLRTFVYIVATLDDTTTINRVGETGLNFSKAYAKNVLNSKTFAEDIMAMDKLYTKKNISTGGCADTMELVYFFKHIDDFMASYMKDFLDAKEARWKIIIDAIERYKRPIITLNLNIKGMHKDKDEFELLYSKVKTFLSSYDLVYEDSDAFTAVYLAKSDAITEKKKFVNLEESYEYMRFVDIDVIDTSYAPISRSELGLAKRTCIVCGKDRFTCMRDGKHTQEEFNAKLDDALLNLDK